MKLLTGWSAAKRLAMSSPHEMQNPAGEPGFAENEGLGADDALMPPLAENDKPVPGKVQREHLLKRLRRGSVSTLEAFEELGIISSPSAICKLRKLGHAISSVRGTEADYKGRLHTGIARYTLETEEGVEWW